MKNLIMGMLCSVMAIYTIVACLSIYSISSRKNELSSCMAQVVRQNLKNCYAKADDGEAEALVRQDLSARLSSDSQVSVSVNACDMTVGILSVSVTEEFILPNGKKKTLQCGKTAIVETDESLDEEEESEFDPVFCIRFIDRKYFEKASGALVPERQGGLASDSRWAEEDELRSLLRAVLAGN